MRFPIHCTIKKSLLIIALLFVGIGSVQAQPLSWIRKTYRYKLIVGLGWGAMVEDLSMKTIFNVSDYWHIQPYPAHLTAQFYVNKAYSCVFTGNYMRYSPTKRVEGLVGNSNAILNLDLGVKAHSHAILDLGFIDPFGLVGVGYTQRMRFSNISSGVTLNLGIGTDVWAYRNFGISLQAITKVALNGSFYKSRANYLEYDLFITYRFKQNNTFRSSSRAQHKWTQNRQYYRFKKGK